MKNSLQNFLKISSSIPASITLLSHISLVIFIGDFGIKLVENWLVITRFFWQQTIVEYFNIFLSDAEKDYLTTIVFFTPIALTSFLLRHKTSIDDKTSDIATRLIAILLSIFILIIIAKDLLPYSIDFIFILFSRIFFYIIDYMRFVLLYVVGMSMMLSSIGLGLISVISSLTGFSINKATKIDNRFFVGLFGSLFTIIGVYFFVSFVYYVFDIDSNFRIIPIIRYDKLVFILMAYVILPMLCISLIYLVAKKRKETVTLPNNNKMKKKYAVTKRNFIG